MWISAISLTSDFHLIQASQVYWWMLQGLKENELKQVEQVATLNQGFPYLIFKKSVFIKVSTLEHHRKFWVFIKLLKNAVYSCFFHCSTSAICKISTDNLLSYFCIIVGYRKPQNEIERFYKSLKFIHFHNDHSHVDKRCKSGFSVLK